MGTKPVFPVEKAYKIQGINIRITIVYKKIAIEIIVNGTTSLKSYTGTSARPKTQFPVPLTIVRQKKNADLQAVRS